MEAENLVSETKRLGEVYQLDSYKVKDGEIAEVAGSLTMGDFKITC